MKEEPTILDVIVATDRFIDREAEIGCPGLLCLGCTDNGCCEQQRKDSA